MQPERINFDLPRHVCECIIVGRCHHAPLTQNIEIERITI
jgi:hypothetical protein